MSLTMTHPDQPSLLPSLSTAEVLAVQPLITPPMVTQAAADIRALLTRTAENIRTIGQKLQEVKAVLRHGQWEAWLRQEFDWSLSSAVKMMQVAEAFKSVNLTDLRLDLSSLYLLAQPSTPLAARAEAVALAQDGAAIAVPRAKALINKHRGVIKLEDYQAGQLLPVVQDPAPGDQPYHGVFNRTNEMVDWAWWTWNPITGCLHDCDYCYARDIANRFYPEKFAPTFHPERLQDPHNTPVPPEAATDIRARCVFTVSMGDLFGKWVDQEVIEAVLAAVRAAPQWNFLFLTKFPQRLAEFTWPENAWVGTTVDAQYRVEIAEKAFRKVEASVKWLSCEPLRERLTFSSLAMFDWVVLGGQSASTQAPAFQPPWEWVAHLMRQVWEAGCLLYWKPNLETRPQDYPTGRVRRADCPCGTTGARPGARVGTGRGPTRRRDQLTALQQAILQTVGQLEPCTNAQVKEALGKKRQIVHAALERLVTKGKIVKAGAIYRVVDAPA
jgi:protein gp37